MANDRVEQELDHQLQGIDPFAVARNKAQQQQQQQANAPLQMPDFNLQVGQNSSLPASNQDQSFKDLFKDSGQMTMKDMDTQIQSIMKSLKLDSNSINFTNVGKQNLEAQLKTQFGDNYSNNPKVKPLLDMFSKRMNTFNQDSRQQEAKMLNTGSQTLAFLRGMG